MNRYHKSLLTVFIFALVVFGSCREDFEFTPSVGNLQFSKDTVYLDTVFTNIGSSTYTLKVYNKSDDDILIPEITLRNTNDSNYRLNVDGLAGNQFEDVPLLAKDSLFVFIETTFDITATGENEFLYTDTIRFGESNNFQEVELVTLVRDAIFLYPRTESDGSKETLLLGLDGQGNEIRIEGFVLDDEELLFTKEKPYVIYGYAAVADGKTLTMEAGTRVHFHKDSGILVGTGGSIQVLGTLSSDSLTLENEVIFEGDRLEPEFSDVPGQWGTIWLTPGSSNNTIEYLTIKNATVGLLVEGGMTLNSPTLTLSNSQIHNSSSINLWNRAARVEAQNSIFGNAGSISLYCNLGGEYTFSHCTIANYWTSGFRNSPALFIDDNLEFGNGQIEFAERTKAIFSNCVIDGNRDLELLFSREGNGEFDYQFQNCSIKFQDRRQDFIDNPLYDFENQALFSSTLINPTVAFIDTAKNNFQLSLGSEILDIGDVGVALAIPTDILGVSRTASPDLGAYELNP